MTLQLRIRRFTLVFTGILVAAACGCAKTGTVEGKATVDGKPATGATVIFSGGDNQSVSAIVQDDGTYEAPRVPVGEVKAAFMPPMMMGMRKGMPSLEKIEPSTKSIPELPQAPAVSPTPTIPKRYTDVKTSGLTLTVKGGRNEFNIEMTSR